MTTRRTRIGLVLAALLATTRGDAQVLTLDGTLTPAAASFSFAPVPTGASGGGVGKIVELGRLPLNLQLSPYSKVETPETFGADWQLRFQLQVLLPKAILK